jgi:ADP-ribosyl-[dinitrogen reductase] hydrolase
MHDKRLGILVGLAVGDAIGTTVEFMKRGSFEPVTDMVGGGPFNLKAGQWTDDTSMALCLAESIIKDGFDAYSQVTKYVAWWKHGYLSSTGTCFDIGFTTRLALSGFDDTGDPFSGDEGTHSAGNGGLMRIGPVVMAYGNHANFSNFVTIATKTTHPNIVCIEASLLFCDMINKATITDDKLTILTTGAQYSWHSEEIAKISVCEYMDLTYEQLSGSGYVVDSLKTALWCFYNTDNFKDAVLMAVNVGDDADTVAAICGQIAGAYYGLSGIPTEWVQKLCKLDIIMDYSHKLCEQYDRNIVINR